MNNVMWRDDIVYPASAYRAACEHARRLEAHNKALQAEVERLRELACTCPWCVQAEEVGGDADR